MNIGTAGKMLEKLRNDIALDTGKALTLHTQKVKPQNMSFLGGIGRLYVQPKSSYWDVSPSTASLEARLVPCLTNLFGRAQDGYKHKSLLRQPYWRTTEFSQVEDAVKLYAETIQ